MPLFKKHNNNGANATDRNAVERDVARAEQRPGAGQNQDLAHNNRAGVNDASTNNNWAPGTGAGTGNGAGYNSQAGGPGAQGYPAQGNWDNTNAGGPGYNADYNNGTGPTAANSRIPPTGAINQTQQTSGGGGGGRLAGKMEHAVGTMVGSQALKEKGLQKEQEADAFKTQSMELAEAERLEREAMLRRERAVAHGAHPANKNLGGAQNVDQNLQTGARGY
ncbi:hypothetical protein OBBRIDRAFT_835644 [Obba rivulosa]|uniref:Uncharacterized protein n=1 Tax=Obba rivulosa TaxID=1052685 RepID=A0A8E2AS67_9APHY|nr:hypothetical protein OBBRIDRAFT_835644 [Obba rivulosa]